MIHTIRRRLPHYRVTRDATGAVAAEYALIAAIIGIGILSSLNGVRKNVQYNYNTISYGLAVAAKSGAPPKTVTGTAPAMSYMDDGRQVDQKFVMYSDGSYDIVRSSSFFKQSTTSYNANNVETGSVYADLSGNVYMNTTTVISPGTMVYDQTGQGSCNCTYMTSGATTKNADGSFTLVNTNTVMNDKNNNPDLYKTQIVVYNYGNGYSNYVGDVQTMKDGRVISYGSDISKYLN